MVAATAGGYSRRSNIDLDSKLSFRDAQLAGINAQIAVVDDDAGVRDAIANLLRALDYDVTTFDSGQAFMGSGTAVGTRCLIADVQMPEMSGIELLERIDAEHFAIPTIFVTAHPRAAIRAQAMKLGAVAYLDKPIRQQALLDCVEKALRSPA